METVVFMIGLILAGVFLVSGAAKLADLTGARQAMRDFGVPARYAGALGTLLPIAELLLAVLLFIPITSMFGAFGAIGLLAAFNVAIAANLSRGRKPNCRCFGQIHSTPISARMIGRNGGLMLLAAVVGSYGQLRADAFTSTWAEGLVFGTIITGILAFVLLEFVDLSALARRLNWYQVPVTQVSEKAVALGVLSPQSVRIPGDDPLPQLPVGAAAPAFCLLDTEERPVSLDNLLEAGSPVVLLFIDPECELCEAVLSEINSWEQALEMGETIQVIGCGTIEEHRAKGRAFGIRSILVQDDWEVADAYGVEGIPSAVLINADGAIDGEFAEGPADIRLLMSRLKQASPPKTSPR